MSHIIIYFKLSGTEQNIRAQYSCIKDVSQRKNVKL